MTRGVQHPDAHPILNQTTLSLHHATTLTETEFIPHLTAALLVNPFLQQGIT